MVLLVVLIRRGDKLLILCSISVFIESGLCG
uniref:Uncharacterized protein n=1 Tax=Rhizophora mucronata TaxID=61149 RepID=A0A2P2PRN7_RHIMU